MPYGIPEVPVHLDRPTKDFLTQLRQQVIELTGRMAPLGQPLNFRATAQAFQVTLQWTRVDGADYYEILWNSKPTTSGAQIIDVGNSSQYTDNVGADGVTRYYWVRARRNTGAKSLETGYQMATTLAAGTPATIVTNVAPAANLVLDPRTGHPVPLQPSPLAGDSKVA